jgi:hypothetical protein
MRLERRDGGIEVSFDDGSVNLVLLDYRLGLNVLDSDSAKLHISIATEMSAGPVKATSVRFDPEEDDGAIGELAASLRHRKIRSCVASQAGDLKLEFDSGLTIDVPSDASYEAWQLDGPEFKVVAKPGGGLAVWDRGRGR